MKPGVGEHWYDEAVIYCLDVETYADSDGDGVGDFRGLIGRLDYLYRLGVTCLWLNPIHPSPRRDDGHDVTDLYTVEPPLCSHRYLRGHVHPAELPGIRGLIELRLHHHS